MRLNSKLSVLLGLAAPGLAFPGPSVAFLNDRSPNLARAQAVKSAFRTSWDGKTNAEPQTRILTFQP